MKKFLVILMVLALCVLTFVACEPQQPVDPQPEVTYDANAAVTYVFNLYKDSTTKQEDFEVTATVQVGGIAYDIEWTASEGATVTKKDDKTYTVDIDEKSATGYEFTLTATAKAADGTTAQKAIKFNVPKYEVLSFEQYMAAKEGDSVTIEGIVVAINSKAAGNKYNHLFLADASGKGGYYCYSLANDPIEAGIELGMTVSVSGSVAPYSGMQEIKGGTAKIVDSNKKEVAVFDITDKILANESLKNYVGLPVTIKGVEIAGQELEKDTSQYLKFKIGEITSYVRTYVTDFPTTLKAEDKAGIDAAHAEKFGWKANATGILVLYNSAPYLIPMDTGCFEYLEKVEKTDEQKIADTLEGLKLDTSFSSDAVVELLAAGAAYPEVTLTWTSNSEHAVIADGKLTITVPDAATEVIVTVTATCNGKTATKEFKIKLSKTVTPVADIIALGASKEHNTYTEGKYYVTGVITEIYNTQYGNMKITDDKGNILTIYGTYSADGADRFDAMANQPAVGDTVTIYGIVGQYNNTPQIKNGWITEQKPAAPEAPSFIEVPIDSDKWDQCKLKLDFQEMPMSQHRNWAVGSSLHAGAFMYRYGEIAAVGEAPVIDISGMKYIEFDVYVSHIDVIAEALFSFELTSSGASDKEENCKKFYGKDTGWVVGWNHVKWNLSDFTEHGPDGKPMDATKWNFIRWYNDSTITVGEEKLKVAIANIKFTNDDYVAEEKPEEPETPETPETPATGNTIDMPSFSLGDGKDTAYADRTNSQGWTTTGAAILTGKEYAGMDTWAITLNGKTSAPGSLTSPVLAGGIKSLSFKYGFPFSDTQFKITISIKKGDEVVASTVLEKTDLTSSTVYEFTWNLETPVDGEFTIEIVNNCLSASTKNKDRLSLWDITWVNN